MGAYAYCERAWWYDHHPPHTSEGSALSASSYARGREFQARALAAHLRAQQTSRAPYILLTFALLVALGLVLWEYHLLPFSWPSHW